MSYNFFWFSGTIISSGFSKTGDWLEALRRLGINNTIPFTLISGIAAYYGSIKLVNFHLIKIRSEFPGFPIKLSLFYSFFSGAAAAVIAGSFFQPDRIHASYEGLLEMINSIPLIYLGLRETVKSKQYNSHENPAFYVFVGLLFIIFCLTLGSGLSF